MADHFNEARFRRDVDECIRITERVLGTTRHPVLPENVQHTCVRKIYRIFHARGFVAPSSPLFRAADACVTDSG